ncbi:MAG: type IV pilus biogenesis/stability protein PilW [Burkholderiales bacterium]|uniref:type IV pilus biogenesis/stability protein PilW n=1 Tax=Inhella sp. TaxID=1921806 RepID=UPI001ACA28DD|nr:type IV pilus biogenesis/stability protein PilW [Burkholderiales bacterium]
MLRLPALALLLSLTVLAGCATQTVRDNEPRTEFDASQAEKRAATRVELAAGYFARGQHTIALDELKQALALQPNSRDALNLRALVLAAMGDTAAAEESFRRLLSIYPGDGDTWHNQAWFFCQQGRVDAAMQSFETALRQPNYRGVARSWLARGACEMRHQRWTDAQQSLTRAFELDPANPAAAFNLAETLLRLGQAERAKFYAARVNAVTEQVTAQSLWLATRIEHRLGNRPGVQEFGQRLAREFPQSQEALAFGAGRFE